MKATWPATAFGLVAFALASFLSAPAALAQSFVERVSDDPCLAAEALGPEDESANAEHLRRRCRLQAFEDRLATERRQREATEAKTREERIEAWAAATQPSHTLRPIAVLGFVGSGVSNYGLAVTWDVLQRLELEARVGWRKMTCWDQFSADGGDCTRRTIGVGARWFLSDKDISPFVAGGFATTGSHLQILQPMTDGGSKLLTGSGRANSLSGGGGLQLAVHGFRASVEYVYEWAFYTGANQDEDMTPSPDLTTVWGDSLSQDRHGVRLEAGYAF